MASRSSKALTRLALRFTRHLGLFTHTSLNAFPLSSPAQSPCSSIFSLHSPYAGCKHMFVPQKSSSNDKSFSRHSLHLTVRLSVRYYGVSSFHHSNSLSDEARQRVEITEDREGEGEIEEREREVDLTLSMKEEEEREISEREKESESEREREEELLQELAIDESEPSVSLFSSSTFSRYSPLLTMDDVSKVLEKTRARDVAVMDVMSQCEWTDWMVVATGHSTRHLRGVADALVDQAKLLLERRKDGGGSLPVIEGKSGGEWVAVDCGNIVVHILSESARAEFKLEQLWQSHQNRLE